MIEIVKWSVTFETADNRKRQRLGWYGPPSGCDSRGYMKLMRDGVEGAAAFGIFHALCQLMATLNKDIRAVGIFKNSDGSLMDLDDILDKTRLGGMQPADFRHAIGRLVACKWLALHKPLELEQNAGDVPETCRPSATPLPQGEGQGEGQGQVEVKGEGDSVSHSGDARELSDRPAESSSSKKEQTYPPFINDLWAIHPKKGRARSSMAKTAKAWKATTNKPSEAQVIDALKKWAAYEDWTKQGGQFVPGLHTWISERKWEHTPETDTPTANTNRFDDTYHEISD